MKMPPLISVPPIPTTFHKPQTEKQRQAEIYAETRMIAGALALYLIDFVRNVGAKYQLKKDAIAANNAVKKLIESLDNSSALTAEENKMMKKEGHGISGTFAEIVRNLAYLPDSLVDEFSKDLEQLAKAYAEPVQKLLEERNNKV